MTNLQGDVIGIVNGSGTSVVTYTYDAWGNPISTSGTMASTLGTLNPLRYRGYVYDTETGLYYLQSRYYNPTTGRFLNADILVSTGQGLLGNNMFAYCLNNPANYSDPSGEFGLITALIVAGAVVGGLLGAFNAATTGGNVIEGTIEGTVTGAIGTTCSLLMPNFWAAVGMSFAGGFLTDVAVQGTVQYVDTQNIDLTKIKYTRSLKVGAQTGLGTAVPACCGVSDGVSAFGTGLIWAIASTYIVVADIAITKFTEASNAYRNANVHFKEALN